MWANSAHFVGHLPVIAPNAEKEYTSAEVQCSVFVVDWQDIAPNGLLAAIEKGDLVQGSLTWPTFD